MTLLSTIEEFELKQNEILAALRGVLLSTIEEFEHDRFHISELLHWLLSTIEEFELRLFRYDGNSCFVTIDYRGI